MKKTLSAAFILSLAVSPSFAMLRGSWARAAPHKNADFGRRMSALIHSGNLERGQVYPTPRGDFKYLGKEGRDYRFEGPDFINQSFAKIEFRFSENGRVECFLEDLGWQLLSL